MIPLRDDNPSTIAPLVTVSLIAACVLVFLWELSLGPNSSIVYSLGAIPAVLLGQKDLPPEWVVVPPLLTMLTSMFTHAGWLHLLGNMLYLWIFGDNVEDSMGHGRFLVFYVLCGLAAVFAQALPEPQSEVPMVGASGAISGVLGAYLLLYPHARVLVVIPLGFFLHTTRLPAALVLDIVVWFAIAEQLRACVRRWRRRVSCAYRWLRRRHAARALSEAAPYASLSSTALVMDAARRRGSDASLKAPPCGATLYAEGFILGGRAQRNSPRLRTRFGDFLGTWFTTGRGVQFRDVVLSWASRLRGSIDGY